MRTTARILISAAAIFGFASFAHAHGTAAPAVLSGSCTNWPSPRVNLFWTMSHFHLTNVEKGDHPGGTYWGFVGSGGPVTWGQTSVNYGQTSYVDTNIAAGTTYGWRVKTDAGVGSNVYTVTVNSCNCGGGCPPTDNATVTATAPANVTTGQPFNVVFLATNTGTTAWNASYSLNATNAANSALWSAATSTATGTVNPGGISVRVVPFTAPGVAGSYPIAAWRMFKAGPGFFGSASNAPSVTVTAPNQPAVGSHETTTCAALTGWAQDPDTPATGLTVRIYRDGIMGVGVLTASPTANGAHSAPYNGHGYTWTPPTDSISHTYYIYALDPQSGLWTILAAPTPPITCSPAPSVTLTSVTQGNYCIGGPQATVNWQYTSPGSLPQTQWQLQVASDPAFGTLVYDPGIKPTAPTIPPPSVHTTGTGTGVLQFGTTYWFHVRAWDSMGQPSAWSAPLTTTTAASAYPTANFTYTPTAVYAAQPVQFVDASTNSPTAWAWNFGDSQVGSGPNPVHIYTTQGSYSVKLDATNTAGTCSVTKILNANPALPNYREVRPGGQ